jgi:hypothetical protein
MRKPKSKARITEVGGPGRTLTLPYIGNGNEDEVATTTATKMGRQDGEDGQGRGDGRSLGCWDSDSAFRFVCIIHHFLFCSASVTGGLRLG